MHGQNTPVPFDNLVTTLMTDMYQVFENIGSSNIGSFNEYIGSWDTRNVIHMNYMIFKNGV